MVVPNPWPKVRCGRRKPRLLRGVMVLRGTINYCITDSLWQRTQKVPRVVQEAFGRTFYKMKGWPRTKSGRPIWAGTPDGSGVGDTTSSCPWPFHPISHLRTSNWEDNWDHYVLDSELHYLNVREWAWTLPQLLRGEVF